MQTITSVLTDDHRYADDLFAAATREAAQGAWEGSARQLALFRAALETHMKIEEDMLFPAFEQATGNTRGPTAVMRSEHVKMLAQLDDISRAIEARDIATFQSLTQSDAPALAWSGSYRKGRSCGARGQQSPRPQPCASASSDQLR